MSATKVPRTVVYKWCAESGYGGAFAYFRKAMETEKKGLVGKLKGNSRAAVVGSEDERRGEASAVDMRAARAVIARIAGARFDVANLDREDVVDMSKARAPRPKYYVLLWRREDGKSIPVSPSGK